MSSTAFVSGANGYIAIHLVKLLISKNYKVVGSVRSEAKGQNLKSHFPTNFKYEIVPELGAPGAFDTALEKHKDVSVFFHTASPLRFGLGDIQENLLTPAVEGAKNALKAVNEHGKNVKRFVLTSSYGAIGYSPNGDPNSAINEDSWTNITLEQALENDFLGYLASKTYAEKAAWDYVKTEKPHFDLVVVNPTYVFGPQAFDPEKGAELNASVGILQEFLKLTPSDPYPVIAEGYFYDVRDVAKAHLFAGENKEAIGKRLLLNAGYFNGQLIADTLHKLYPQLKNVPVGDPSSTKAYLEAQAKAVDSSRSAKLLGFEPISWEKSIKDTFDQFFASQ